MSLLALPRSLLLAAGCAAAVFHTSRAEAAPTIGTVQPPAAVAVADQVVVQAAITSPFVLSSVTADIAGVTKAMTNVGGGSTWQTSLDISAVPVGPVTLTVTATDSTGDTASITRALIHDRPPVLVVTTKSGSVARPSLRLQATCSDGDTYGCASITVGAYASVASAGAASLTLDQTPSLAADEGRAITLRFVATDSAGLKTEVLRDVVVESSLIMTRFRGHPSRREDAPGVFDGEEAGSNEAAGVHPRVQGRGRPSLQGGRPDGAAGREGPGPDGDGSA